MSERYSYEIELDGTIQLVDPQGTQIGRVLTEEDAAVLVPYLNAAEGGFTAAPHSEAPDRREWAFVNPEDIWVAYTDCEASADAILTHLNRRN